MFVYKSHSFPTKISANTPLYIHILPEPHTKNMKSAATIPNNRISNKEALVKFDVKGCLNFSFITNSEPIMSGP